MFFVLIHDYTLCFTGSPYWIFSYCKFSYYNYISIWPYYIVIHVTYLEPICLTISVLTCTLLNFVSHYVKLGVLPWIILSYMDYYKLYKCSQKYPLYISWVKSHTICVAMIDPQTVSWTSMTYYKCSQKRILPWHIMTQYAILYDIVYSQVLHWFIVTQYTILYVYSQVLLDLSWANMPYYMCIHKYSIDLS